MPGMDFKGTTFSTASRLGLGEETLSLYSRFSSWPKWLPDVDTDIASYSLPKNEVRGSIFLPLVEGSKNPYIYCLLAHAFRTRAYRPLLLLCDRDLPLCFRKDSRGDHLACDRCHFQGSTVLDEFGLEPVSIQRYAEDVDPASVVNQAPDKRDLTYRGIDISGFALSSTRRFLKRHRLDIETDPDGAVYDTLLESAVLLTEVTHNLLNASGDVLAAVGVDGAYVYGGIPQKVAQQHGIPVHNFCVGYTDGTLLVGNENIRSPMITDPTVVENFLSTPLSMSQRDAVESMMAGRRDGSKVRVKWSGDSSDPINVEADTLVSMFTNLMWDASLEVEHEAAFGDAYDWIRTTLAELGGREGVTLVLKPHPAEAFRGTNESVVDWLDESYDSHPPNVVVLNPDTEVGPYSLLAETDLALVWNSTIGLEAAYDGIPTVVSGVAHYRGYNFTFDAANPEEYRLILETVDREMTNTMINRAQRYAYFLFIAKQVDFPFFETIDGKRQLKPVHHDQLTPGNENIDAIVQGVVNDEAVFRIPDSHRRHT